MQDLIPGFPQKIRLILIFLMRIIGITGSVGPADKEKLDKRHFQSYKIRYLESDGKKCIHTKIKLFTVLCK